MLEKYPDVLNVKEVCTILRISRKTVYAGWSWAPLCP